MTLTQILAQHDIVPAPGAYDALSARVIEQAGFPLVYFTGLGNEASDLGFPDIGLTTATEMVRRVANVVQCVDVPVICDADTGFGGAINVTRTVRLFEAAGVTAIHLEDQTFPKRCGLLAGKQVVPAETFAKVIDTALAARRTEGFQIIARSDAKASDGVDGVIARFKLYAEHGAHAAMVGDFYTLAEYTRIAAEIPIPLITIAADKDHFHLQPDHSVEEWQQTGVAMVFYWHLPLFAALHGVRQAVETLRQTGSTQAVSDRVAGYNDYAAATGLDEWMRLADS
jgi:2-methylisocitrate lyase-like PEP mutase family enzyme